MARRQATVDPTNHPNESFHLFSIPAFDNLEPETLIGADIGSAKKTVEPGDVLLSRIVPHIRRAWAVPEKNGKRQIASSEWIVFRGEQFFPPYLRYFLTSDQFHVQFMNTVAGVGGSLLRARPDHVAKIPVVLPKLEEQKRIAAILDKADAIRRQRQTAKTEIAELRRATFLDFFGAPAINNHEWPTAPIADVCTKVTDGTHDTPPRLSEGILLLTGKNIRPFRVDLTQTDYVSPHDHQEIYRRCNPEFGDILYTNIGVNVGTAVMNPFHHEFSMKNVALLKPQHDMVMSRYLEFLLNDQQFLHKMLASSSKGGAQSFLSLTSIRQATIPVPDLSLQRRFEDFANHLSETEKRCEQHELEIAHLFNSLVQRAFKGEL